MAKQKPSKRPRRRLSKARARPRKARILTPARRAVEAALAGIVHDIRTPLTGSVARAELSAPSDIGAREREWATAIKSGADHLAALTTLIVDAVKADAAGLILQHEPFSPRRLAEAVGAALTARAARRSRKGLSRRPYLPAGAVLAAAAGRGGRRRADRARRQQRHQSRHRVRARSAGDGGRRRAATARGTGKPGRQCGQIHQ